jgi:oxygen-dependent protoporphyrinogen oxidase
METPGKPRKIAVIGGGISGLAAAHRIGELDPGAEVTLFEASNRLGGVIRTIRQDGFLIEQSADSFITNVPAAVDLCRRIGLGGELLQTDPNYRGASVVSRGRLRPIPEGFLLMAPERIWPIVTSPILSWRGKLRLARERWIKQRVEGSDESVASFARRRLGGEAFERLVQPLVGGIYTGDPERLSLAATLPRFLEMERKHGSLTRAMRTHAPGSAARSGADSGARYSLFVAPRDGLSSFIETIAARLPAGSIILNAPVEQIERRGGQWSLVAGQNAEGKAFDAVIVATPARVVANLLKSIEGDVAGELLQIEHAGTAIVVMVYDRSQIAHPLDSFGFVVPAIEQRRILSASFSSLKFRGRAPDGKVLIRVFLGGALQPEMLDRTDDELRRIAEEELRGLMDISGSPYLSLAFRWPAVMPQYHVGHLDRLARINAGLAKLPGLALAGNAYEGVGIPQCIKSGESAAERVIAQLANS